MSPYEIEITVKVLPSQTKIDSLPKSSFSKCAIDGIKQRQEDYPEWGWCEVDVTASIKGVSGTERIFLVTCESEEEFRDSSDFLNGRERAVKELWLAIKYAEQSVVEFWQFDREHF